MTKPDILRSENEDERELNQTPNDLNFSNSVDSNSVSSNDNDSSAYDPKRFNIMNYGVTSSRSVSAKINSVVENMKELQLHFLIVSETWLRKGRQLEAFKGELQANHMGIIHRNRLSCGGGIAIIFDSNKMSLKESFRFRAGTEAVCKVGRCAVSNRRKVIVGFYIPPKTDSTGLLGFKVQLKEKLEQIKADIGEFDLYVGGNANRKDIRDSFESFPSVQMLQTRPTRGDATLDVCFSNISDALVKSRI